VRPIIREGEGRTERSSKKRETPIEFDRGKRLCPALDEKHVRHRRQKKQGSSTSVPDANKAQKRTLDKKSLLLNLGTQTPSPIRNGLQKKGDQALRNKKNDRVGEEKKIYPCQCVHAPREEGGKIVTPYSGPLRRKKK